MFRNYLKVAVRHLLRHKGYTFINVVGLAVGIAAVLLITLFVRSEWSFDRFHGKHERLYRAWLEEHYEGQVFQNVTTPIPLGPTVQAGVPEIEAACRVAPTNVLVKHQQVAFKEMLNMVDDNFFRVFDFELTEGSRARPFPSANSIILSDKAAKKYFGTRPALGQTLRVQLGDTLIGFTVSGVTGPVPAESSIQFELLTSYAHADVFWPKATQTDGWGQVFLETFFLLKPGASVATAAAKTAALLSRKVSRHYKPGEYVIHYQPLTDIHLNNSLPAGNVPTSDPAYAYALATVGVLILLIACVNFITLAMGRSATRAREVGVRKVLGAGESQLLGQYFGEAVLVTAAALLLGAAMAAALARPFSVLAGRALALRPDLFTVGFGLALAAVVAVVAGAYPAVVLARFAPIQALRGQVRGKADIGLLRKLLVVGQFTASIVLIIGTLGVGYQLHYLRTKSLGYQQAQVVVVQTNKPGREGFDLARRFGQRATADARVTATAVSLFSMAEPRWLWLSYQDDHHQFRSFQANQVEADFLPALGLHLTRGRNFSPASAADEAGAIIVNEALVREYGWADPIGQKLPGPYPQRIIGVVADFHYESLYTKIQPLVLSLNVDSLVRHSSNATLDAEPRPRVSVRLAAGAALGAQVAALKTAWQEVAPDQDFDYRFLDEALQAQYQQAERLGELVQLASGLAICIACLGLFGLATLVVARRTKEIGIRKVLGADVSRLVALLSREFVGLVGVAALVAFPIAWWMLHRWLADFAYRAVTPWWAFAGAAALALLIALLTVSFQTVRAAIANPVRSLRAE